MLFPSQNKVVCLGMGPLYGRFGFVTTPVCPYLSPLSSYFLLLFGWTHGCINIEWI